MYLVHHSLKFCIDKYARSQKKKKKMKSDITQTRVDPSELADKEIITKPLPLHPNIITPGSKNLHDNSHNARVDA